MVGFGLGLRAAAIKHRNHLQGLCQAAVTQLTSRTAAEKGTWPCLGQAAMAQLHCPRGWHRAAFQLALAARAAEKTEKGFPRKSTGRMIFGKEP